MGRRRRSTASSIPMLFAVLFCFFLHSGSSSVTKRDITTPITTVPTITPSTTTTTTTPTSPNPVLNPTSTPETTTTSTSSSPTITTSPSLTPANTTAPVSAGASWCVASQSASHAALQAALDYACGYGADCSAIQPSGRCYNPNTLRDHASYAFNAYYQKNPVPSSCNFGGTAVSTSTDPSTGACQYQSTSTTSSILNTTNSNGATVYGAVPNPPSPSTSLALAAAKLHGMSLLFPVPCFLMLQLVEFSHYHY